MLTYGLVCKIASSETHQATLSSVRNAVRSWYEAKMQRLEPDRRDRFRNAERDYVANGSTVWEFTLSQPTEGYDATWLTEIRALGGPPEIKCAVSMRIVTRETKVAPLRYYVETPGFVRAFEKQFMLHVGATRATTECTKIDPSGIENLVTQLSSPQRSLPIVLVTHPSSGPPLLPDLGNNLARYLLALATVVELTKDATFTFTAIVGKEMSCFDGGIRVYWPDWSVDDSPWRHPLFLKERTLASIGYDAENPDKLIRIALMARLARASVARFESVPEIEHVIEQAKAQEKAAILAKLTASGLDELRRKVDELGIERDLYKEMVESLEVDNKKLQEELRELSERVAELESGEDEDSGWEIESIEEALERARNEFVSTLIIPPHIPVDTSMATGYWFNVLRAVHELCQLQQHGSLGRSASNVLAELLNKHCMTYALMKTGDTAVWLPHPDTGENIHLRHRVHLKEGRPGETESIYFEPLGKGGDLRYLIGRLGRHAYVK